MKTFIKNFLVFILGLVFINMFLYYTITYNLLYADYEVPVDVLDKYDKFIFSDSHGWALTQNKPGIQEKLGQHGVFNFSYGSDAYYDIYMKIWFLLENSIHVDTVFLSVDDHMLSPYRDRANNKFRSIYFTGYEVFNQQYGISIVEFYLRKYIIRWIPMLSTSNSRLIKEYLISLISYDKQERQQLWHELDLQEQQEKCMERKKSHFPNEKRGKAHRSFQAIIDMGKQHGFHIVGLKFPLSPLYIETIGQTTYGADTILQEQGFEVWDFKGLLQDEKYFSNQDHVNEIGANELLMVFLDKQYDIKSK